WMAKLIGYPETAGGYLASGGSVANLTAIVAAREAAGITIENSSGTVVYLTSQSHHCIIKALAIAGLGRCIIRYIEMDDQFRMNTFHLRNTILSDKKQGHFPWLIIASAGTTDTGAIDPLNEIADIAEEFHLRFHVDAAYGGFFLLNDEIKNKMKGIERAHSVVLDPHKALFIPYGSGALIVRDINELKDIFHFDASYMQDTYTNSDDYSPADVSPELSKHFRGLRMWLPLKLHGVASFRAAIEEKLLLARYAWEKLNEMEGFETGPYPELSVITFRYLPDDGIANEFNKNLYHQILKDGRIFLSTTEINGLYVLRLAVVSVRTHLKEVNRALDIIREKVSAVEALMD
ncbi:MAG: pyridoxal phosphate-dependent decarboxylase family protein, partial [Balneolaceae bacterium]